MCSKSTTHRSRVVVVNLTVRPPRDAVGVSWDVVTPFLATTDEDATAPPEGNETAQKKYPHQAIE